MIRIIIEYPQPDGTVQKVGYDLVEMKLTESREFSEVYDREGVDRIEKGRTLLIQGIVAP